MRKLIAFEFISLDGFMAGPPGHEMDFVLTGFDRDMEQDLAEQYKDLDAFVMGRTTFQSLETYWPTSKAEAEPLQGLMNTMEKLVCSSTITEARWSNSRILRADVATEIERLKHSPGKDIMIIGSAKVVQSLTRLGLIDEFRFFLFPVVLGSGKSLFDAQSGPVQMRLLQTKYFTTDVVRLDYARA